MIDVNLPNFITVALIAVLATLALRTVAKLAGKASPV